MIEVLLLHAGETLSKNAIIDEAWPQGHATEANLMVQISRLRQLLKDAGAGEIHTLRGEGYRFDGMVVEAKASGEDLAQGEGHGLRWRLCVEPFVNPDDRFDGFRLCEAICEKLTRLAGLRVHLADRPLDRLEDAKAEVVLRGSISDHHLELHLFDAFDSTASWSHRFEIEGLHAEELATRAFLKLSNILGTQLLSVDSPTVASPRSEELRALCFEGIYEHHRSLPASLARARECFDRCLEIDPDHVQARAYRVMTLIQMWYADQQTAIEVEHEIDFDARHLLQLVPDHSVGHTARGALAFALRRDFRESDASLARALAIAPNELAANEILGYSLIARARFGEGRSCLWRALAANPTYTLLRAHIGTSFALERQYAESLAEYEAALVLEPSHVPTHLHRVVAATLGGYAELALTSLEHAQIELGNSAALTGVRGFRAAWNEDPVGARAALAELDQHPKPVPFLRARIYAALGQVKETLLELRRAVADPTLTLCALGVDPAFDRVREDPGFGQFVAEIGLDPAAQPPD